MWDMFSPTQAWDYVGGLSEPSKMPCYSYSTSALNCHMGGKLRAVKGSVCEKCYAMRGNYRFENVAKAHAKRLQSIEKPFWVEAMTTAISYYEKSGFFRWSDSGDIQNSEHLRKICEIARRLPHVQFWLPTKEASLVSAFVKSGETFPPNLVVRLSAFMLGQKPSITLLNNLGIFGSAVSKKDWTCPAHTQENQCKSCRLCWDKNIKIITYHYH